VTREILEQQVQLVLQVLKVHKDQRALRERQEQLALRDHKVLLEQQVQPELME
jgi:hypothetical protein